MKWLNGDKPTLEIRKPRAPFATPLKVVPVGERAEPLQRGKQLSATSGLTMDELRVLADEAREINKRLDDTDEWPVVKPDRTAQREASQVVIAAVMMTIAAVLGYVICYLQHFAAGGVR